MTDATSAGEARYDADAHTRAGVYANHVEIVLSEHEVTLDFVRVDYDDRSEGGAVLVARVAMAWSAAHDLIDGVRRLEGGWRTNAGRVT